MSCIAIVGSRSQLLDACFFAQHKAIQIDVAFITGPEFFRRNASDNFLEPLGKLVNKPKRISLLRGFEILDYVHKKIDYLLVGNPRPTFMPLLSRMLRPRNVVLLDDGVFTASNMLELESVHWGSKSVIYSSKFAEPTWTSRVWGVAIQTLNEKTRSQSLLGFVGSPIVDLGLASDEEHTRQLLLHADALGFERLLYFPHPREISPPTSERISVHSGEGTILEKVTSIDILPSTFSTFFSSGVVELAALSVGSNIQYHFADFIFESESQIAASKIFIGTDFAKSLLRQIDDWKGLDV